MFVIGTAGHVDHGKSTLVQALTGIDPDRLAEEKARAMTIDLGFAWLRLDGIDDEIGVVDVPGHRDFIENMLAGVGGVDLAVFVIAADEGVMPQTREHLAILDLLEVSGGIIALTKADLIEDEEWLELVMLDVAEAVEGTILEDAPLIPVSAFSGRGMDALKAQLVEKLLSADARPDTGRPRLPVDRVFSISGFGTIVTGTLMGGSLHVGDEIVLQPSGRTGRVRGLQTHKTKRETARPGSRVAVNISGIDKSEVARGEVLTLPDVITPTVLIDTSYRQLADADAPLKHNQEVKLFVGSAEINARTRLIGSEQIAAGETGFVQLALRDSAAVVRGDRFILRRPSPAATLGGGQILDPQPGRQHRRFRTDTVKRLETLAQGTPAELLLQSLARLEPTARATWQKGAGLDEATFEKAFDELRASGQIVEFGKNILTTATCNGWQVTVEKLVTDFHRVNPLRLGMAREEIRSRLGLKANLFNPFVEEMVATGRLVEAGSLLKAVGHAVVFSADQEAAIATLLNQFATAGINAPTVKEAKEVVGEAVYVALLDKGTLVQVNEAVVFSAETYTTIIERIINHLCENQTITVGDLRDIFQTSRKYAIALLEHLDSQRVTRRVDDARELVNRSANCSELSVDVF